MTDPITSERFGNRRIPKMLAQVNAHRAAVAAEGTPLIQDTWDKIEEHIDFAYAKNAAPAVPDDVAGLAADYRTAAKIMGDLDTFPTGQGILRQSAGAIEAQAAELARLTRINSELVKSHNALNLDGARLEDRLATAEDDNRNLRAALERCLNFIDNTECELGMTLECGDIARAALTQTTGDRTNGI